MAMLPARPPRSEPCVNPTLTAPTTPNVPTASVSADQASQLLEHSVWTWMNVDQLLASVEQMLSVSTLWAASPAPVFHHSWAILRLWPARSRARESSVPNMHSAKPKTRRPSVNVNQAGPTTPATLQLDVWMSTSAVNLVPVEITVCAPTCPAATSVSASQATQATPRSDVLT